MPDVYKKLIRPQDWDLAVESIMKGAGVEEITGFDLEAAAPFQDDDDAMACLTILLRGRACDGMSVRFDGDDQVRVTIWCGDTATQAAGPKLGPVICEVLVLALGGGVRADELRIEEATPRRRGRTLALGDGPRGESDDSG